MKNNFIFVLCLVFFCGCTNQGDFESSLLSSDQESEYAEDSLNDYIKETFLEYGYELPDESEWIINYEESEKVVVIIKEYTGRKVISNKLIFTWNGSKSDSRLLKVVINNRAVYIDSK